ncbi:hypothetical protein, partial [Escherichia coli]|uniref:hypothetical protein n=1 Tax=Escherichia coli TaxID=562 RepID=UPI00202289F2
MVEVVNDKDIPVAIILNTVINRERITQRRDFLFFVFRFFSDAPPGLSTRGHRSMVCQLVWLVPELFRSL